MNYSKKELLTKLIGKEVYLATFGYNTGYMCFMSNTPASKKFSKVLAVTDVVELENHEDGVLVNTVYLDISIIVRIDKSLFN